MKRVWVVCVLLCMQFCLCAQNYQVDKEGVLRDAEGKEAVFFGFNYCMPFAHGYRSHGVLGADRKEAIDRDVYHMARLGINAYRIHVWDVEISDGEGNLLENEHLDLLDYTIASFAKRGMKTLITAIAFWGNGWPEADDKSLPGFSNRLGKREATVDKRCVAAQERYLKQLLNHLNPYTGYAYKDDPNIVAVELNNEPDHTAEVPDKEVSAYINRLVKAVKAAGCRKPVFYNIAQNPNRADAVTAARIDGVTCQWYPSGLVSGKARKENFLPAVAHYSLPYDTQGKARIVYEFDAADINGSYMYPAMARSFREAGFQWATQFAYDPLAMAAYNTDYQTHWMNLVYTPAKAVSLRIAAEAFRSLSRGEGYGHYPANNRFGDFRVSYREDLSLLNRDTLYCYSNTTEEVPVAPEKLRHIVGHGQSPVVKYNGSGAYFLDKMNDGSWRIEVYPDVVETMDAYGRRNALNRKVALIHSAFRQMQITLPGMEALFEVKPGVYQWHEGRLEEITAQAGFPVLPDDVEETAVYHTPAVELLEGQAAVICAAVVSPEKVDSVVLYGEMQYGRAFTVRMYPESGFTYAAAIPGDLLKHGIFRYRIGVYTSVATRLFPGNCEVIPGAWDDYCLTYYRSKVVTEHTPVVLLDAQNQPDAVELTWQPGIRFAYLPEGIVMAETEGYQGGAALSADVALADRRLNRVRLETGETVPGTEMTLVLIDRDGFWWSADVILPGGGSYDIPLSAFRPAEVQPVREMYPGFSFAGGISANKAVSPVGEFVSVRLVLKKGDMVMQKIMLEK